MDDHQRARELLAAEYESRGLHQSARDIRTSRMDEHLGWVREANMALAAITAALRAAPEGWSFKRQDDGSIIVTAEGYGIVHVRPDDSDSIAAAMLHLLANDLAARPQGVK